VLFSVIAKSASDEAIHASYCGKYGLLRFARNDEYAEAAVKVTAKAIMTLPATFSFDAPGDGSRAAELRRVKALATLVLAATLALFVSLGGCPTPRSRCPQVA